MHDTPEISLGQGEKLERRCFYAGHDILGILLVKGDDRFLVEEDLLRRPCGKIEEHDTLGRLLETEDWLRTLWVV